ncbi:hypothetical protein chiPu_0006812 [Chiloscyllium punctatum]|uniref:Uncharacterized protein n=1 Tax=Chiloscyllium punctatum TaxID=137246 RepID=A0A401SD86_CHIPU|nr:hypothetical protein [Chiloscyllium punctatum]
MSLDRGDPAAALEPGPPGDLRKWRELVCSREEGNRAAAMERAARTVHACLDHQQRPPPGLEARDQLQLQQLLLLLLRLSRSCPFPDVRERSEHILQTMLVSTASTDRGATLPLQYLSSPLYPALSLYVSHTRV